MRENRAPDAFEAYAAEKNVSAARLTCVLGAVLSPIAILLDWATHPHALRSFLAVRAAGGVLLIPMLLATYTPNAKRHAFALGVAPALVLAAMIEAMIESLEGYSSPYYAGLNLCILAIGVIYTWRGLEAAIGCALIVLIWVVPSLTSPRPVAFGPFFNNLYFLTMTSVIAVASNASRYAMSRREFHAHQRLAVASAELAATLEKLKELDRLKSDFFANVSHELRTPLTLILAPVDELLRSEDSKKFRGSLEVVHRNAERLLRLINDLLDLAKLEAGGLRLNLAPLDIVSLGTQIFEVFRPAASAKGVELALSAEPISLEMFGDPHRLEIIVTNLLGNALKFTPEGGRIEIRIDERDDGAALEVTDTGPGIPPADVEHIFQRFFQVEGSERRRHGGTGIGLALAKELAELHGGTLTVESTVNVGSTFTLWLPSGREHFSPKVIERRRAQLPGHAGRRAEDMARNLPSVRTLQPTVSLPTEDPVLLDGGRRPRVLVAEDQEELRAFVVELLQREFDVTAAGDGEEALELARKVRPDLVLSDVMMPKMSGNDLCRAIKDDPSFRGVPVLLLTAQTGSDETLDSFAHGADDFVSKPFHTRVLLARVRAHLKIRALAVQLATQAQLAAVGTLAAGVLHEIRNPLNSLINAAQLLHGEDLPPALRSKLLDIVADGGQRIEGITTALDQHARPSESGTFAPADVRAGIEATLRLLSHRVAGVEVHCEFATKPLVMVPAGPLNQVLLNLIDNALRIGPRNIWIRVEREGARLTTRVADDGPGVSPEIETRIFDPFFTTRAPGEGTGLGLYLSRQIVIAHGGNLRLERPVAGGAEFVVDLPTAEAA